MQHKSSPLSHIICTFSSSDVFYQISLQREYTITIAPPAWDGAPGGQEELAPGETLTTRPALTDCLAAHVAP